KLKIQANMESSMKKIDTSTQLGHEKLDEQKTKGAQKHQIDTAKLGLEERRQELDFIVRSNQVNAQRQQQKTNAA
ncbi:hypothetical protein LCGC14_0864480, partial [marine sediment metagenome]